MTDQFRALCANLTAALNDWQCETGDDRYEGLIDRARAALADEPAVPKGREPASVTGQPSDEDLLGIACQSIEPYDKIRPGEYEAENNCAIEVYGSELVTFARAVLARWGNSAPQPPAEGEMAELVRMLTGIAHWRRRGRPGEGDPSPFDIRQADRLDRAADLLQRLSPPQPVPVSERLQQMEDLAADAVAGLRYIEQSHGRLYGVGWDRVYKKADRLKPAHALPVPGQEVEG